MMKWGLILIVIGAVVAILFIFLPLYSPDNGLSRAMLTPLLCRSGETYMSATQFGASLNRMPSASLSAYCVAASGERRDVSDTQGWIGMIGGGVPFILGSLVLILGRFVAEFKAAPGMTQRKESPFNPTNAPVRFSKTPSESELHAELGNRTIETPEGSQSKSLSERLAEIDAAYSARRISREEYERLRKTVLDGSNF